MLLLVAVLCLLLGLYLGCIPLPILSFRSMIFRFVRVRRTKILRVVSRPRSEILMKVNGEAGV